MPRFVEHEGLQLIDEIQLAPQLFRAIKLSVDLDPRPGRFLLTGSAQILALKDLPDALPGRMETIELWPFSQGEIDGTADRFVDAAFAHGPGLRLESTMRRRDYLERVVRGGFPEAVRRSARRRSAFFESYVATLIERDVAQLSDISRRGELRKLLTLLAGRAAGVLNVTTLSTHSGLARVTLMRYLDLLMAVFLIKEIPAWSAGTTQRATRSPKVAFVDTGIASHLLDQDATRLGEPGGAAGPLVKNFVLMELARQLTGTSSVPRSSITPRVTASRWTPSWKRRTAASSGSRSRQAPNVRSEDLAGLRHVERRLGDRFVAGYVLYAGQQTLPFGSKIRALPIEALWRVAP